MRVANWNSQNVFSQIKTIAWENGRRLMDEVTAQAQRQCPVSPIVRLPGKFASARVSFTPKTGRNKGKPVSFGTQKRWTGRFPGQLRGTIRRVEKGGSGNIRVYAGNFKVYYAHMVERGTIRTMAQPFLRPAFQVAKAKAVETIKKGL